ncbi:MAG: hypothetical protein LKF31_11390 [Muribaculaceae bacterium]|jgi:hypothetical protein|nr:hypothetical protein [Muribaculaceae bacterium]
MNIEELSPDSSYSETDDDGLRYLRNIQHGKTPIRRAIFVFLIRLICR